MIVNTLTIKQPGFPEALARIDTPPQRIYWSGIDPRRWLDRPKVAVVGSRKLTAYGKLVTEKLVNPMAQAGIVIISGLAFGIDITAHRAALNAGGTTVAVLPSSVEQVYPAAHAHIARQINEYGTLISEYPKGSQIAWKSNFIARNRLISGLADVLVITEAAINSGSLHTARFAMEQGKTVMAVPGNITSLTSEGCNNLIKSGAVPVTQAEDIFFALKLSPEQRRVRQFSGSDQEKLIYELIKDGIAKQEELAVAAKLNGQQTAGILTILELSGYIRAAGSGQWVAA